MKSFYKNNIKEIEEPLNQTCSMSCNYEKFIEYLHLFTFQTPIYKKLK